MENDATFILFISMVSLVFWLIGYFIGIGVNENHTRDAICKQTCITTDCYFKCKEQKFADVINGLRCTSEEN